MKHDIGRFRFTFVLTAFLLYWAVTPLIEGVVGLRILTDLFFSTTLIAAVFAVAQVRRQAAAGALALPMLLSVWLLYAG